MELKIDGEFCLNHCDTIEHMEAMPPACIDLSIFSPPFPSLYAYTSEASDIGNSEDLRHEAKLHLSFFYKQLARIVKPGRVIMVHVAQIPRMKRNGEFGLYDFRGLNIRIGERAGLIFEYDWCITKNPQALKNGTNVLTPRGWKPIESLNVGESVIGSNGTPTNVMGVYRHKSRQMFKVTFSDGASVECDDRHLWQVSTANGPAKTMTTGEILSHGTHAPSGTPRYRIPIISSAVQFEQRDALPIDPYTLGVILGDGNATSRGSVTVTTEHAVIALANPPAGHSWRRLNGSDRAGGAVSSYISNGSGDGTNAITSSLRELGLFGCRAWEKFIPDSYLFSSAWDRLEILRGLMDTDGTIKTRTGIICKFCTTSKKLADGVAFIAQSLGGVARTDITDDNKYQYKGETLTGRRQYHVSLRMPEGCNPFKLPRKADKWQPTKKSICRAIVSITPTCVSDCTCIEVDTADHLYITEHCIVTHNSQAIRTKSRELQFVGLERDRAKARGCLPDYMIKFRAPGENAVPITDLDGQSRDAWRQKWIERAEAAWTDIKETDTLNTKEAKGENDTKHICCLQLELIGRYIDLYSQPNEIVFSPFTGVGGEGYMALKMGRRFYGTELKQEYFNQALKNLKGAIAERKRAVNLPLFGELEMTQPQGVA